MSTPISTTQPKKKTITRTIHPVGQGAFYSETFYDEDEKPFYTAVYDCGGRKTLLEGEIEKLSRVDIVFLSHFHWDHYSGYLQLKRQFSPPIVVIPHISPSRFLVDFVRNSMKDKSGKACSFMLKLLPILRTGIDGEINDGTPTKYRPVKKGEEYSHPVPLECPQWEYLSFYNEKDQAEQNLLKKLKTTLKLPNDCSVDYLSESVYKDIAKLLKDKKTIEEVKSKYAEVFKSGHNSYSMLVLSHEVKSPFCESDGKHFDCLYTGDVNPQIKEERIVKTYNPDYLQVPHHGSNYNHNPNIYNGDIVVFMSVGETNRYRHPGLRTFLELLDKCKKVYVVTEDEKRAFVEKR